MLYQAFGMLLCGRLYWIESMRFILAAVPAQFLPDEGLIQGANCRAFQTSTTRFCPDAPSFRM